MKVIQTSWYITGILFLAIFVFGFWLQRQGKPYPTLVFTVHKLAALAAVVYLGIQIYQRNNMIPLTGLQWFEVILTGLVLLGLFVTGALMSIDKPMPKFVHLLHQVLPYLAVLGSAITIFRMR
jgi:hypothetical protein